MHCILNSTKNCGKVIIILFSTQKITETFHSNRWWSHRHTFNCIFISYASLKAQKVSRSRADASYYCHLANTYIIIFILTKRKIYIAPSGTIICALWTIDWCLHWVPICFGYMCFVLELFNLGNLLLFIVIIIQKTVSSKNEIEFFTAYDLLHHITYM